MQNVETTCQKLTLSNEQVNFVHYSLHLTKEIVQKQHEESKQHIGGNSIEKELYALLHKWQYEMVTGLLQQLWPGHGEKDPILYMEDFMKIYQSLAVMESINPEEKVS